jgi:arylsulfatase A-like enzyme
MKKLPFNPWALASVFATLLCGGVSAENPRPNILFLLADDMRPDAISAFGNDRIQTPNIDQLITEGISFTRATCSNPICVVSRAEILTGRHGWENGVMGFRGNPLKKDNSYWAATLQESGYQTSYVGKWHTSGRPLNAGYGEVAGLFSGGGSKYWKEGQTDWKGFPVTGYRGWIFQDATGKIKYPEMGVGVTHDISSKFADAAISVIEQDHKAPWFCHVNFTSPHDPLFLPPGLEEKYSEEDMKVPGNFLPIHPFDHGNFDGRDEELLHWPRTEEAVRDLLRVYYAVIDDMDAQIGRIIATLKQTGQYKNTIIIFASDHGMGCGSHGLRGKQSQYEHTINVPLIVSGPGISANTSSDAQVYLRELYPTTCDLAGVEIPATVTAKSFAPVLKKETKTHHDDIFGYFTDTQRMVRTGDGWKLVRYPQIDHWQLFDLSQDPLELKNLAESTEAPHRKQFEELKGKLETWRTETGDPTTLP